MFLRVMTISAVRWGGRSYQVAPAFALICILAVPAAARPQEPSLMVEDYLDSDAADERYTVNAAMAADEHDLSGETMRAFTDKIDKLLAENAFGEADELLRERPRRIPT